MNIFFLSICIKRCAKYHFDCHVVKMIVELCQLLSTAWHVLESDRAMELYNENKLCMATHAKHPSAIWVRDHINNYNYTVDLALELCKEWRYRYLHPDSKKHACEDKLLFLKNNPPPTISRYKIPKTKTNPKRFTLPMPQAMYDDCKVNPEELTFNTCQSAYRKYYMSEYKKHIVKWSIKNKNYRKTPDEPKRFNLEKPYWWTA